MTDSSTDAKTDLSKKDIHHAHELFEVDAELKSVDKKWQSLASEASLAKVKASLEARKHKVDIVDNKEAALKLITDLDLKDSSIYLCGSTTLQEIGLTTFLKEHKEFAKRNIKAEFVEAFGKGDQKTAWSLVREGMVADVVFSSVPAIAETGELIVCCGTGSRTGAFAETAKRLVVVIGSNKIVPDLETARKRMVEYALPMESARMRVVYAAMGVKGSAIGFETTIHQSNPYGASNRIHIIIVKEHLGY